MIGGTVTGVDVTITGLENATTNVMKAAFVGVIAALVKANDDAHDMIDATDHSLKQLAEMGHPYGFKHPQQIHDPDEIVHIQSGKYIAALKVTKPSSGADRTIIEGNVGIQGDVAMETLDQRIQLGTPRMRARPWAQKVVDDHGDEYAQIVEEVIIDALEAEAS